MQARIVDLLEGLECKVRHLKRGELLFREGDSGSSFYLVQSGRLRAFRQKENGDGLDTQILGDITSGELVGEMAVLGESVRTAGVAALRDSTVREYTGDSLIPLPQEVLIDFMRVITERLRRMLRTNPSPKLPACVVLVPAGKGVPMDEYAERLQASLVKHGVQSSLLRSRDAPAEMFGKDGSEAQTISRLGKWLDAQENKASRILLQCDPDLTPWTRRCLRQADLILIIARAGDSPEKGAIERALDAFEDPVTRPRTDLVLLQKQLPFTGTGEWLKRRTITRHYHIRLDSEADKDRAGRLLTGQDLSLALGGGGARGFAHIGILKACQELDIPIDRIGGTSMGAMVGGLFALGLPSEEITERIRTIFLPKRNRVRYTFPLMSLDTGKGYNATLHRLFGDVQIEDLPINFFCVSANLSKAQIVVHRTGSLARWVGASMSIPGIVPPLVVNGECLVDGGLLNNLPVDIAGQDGAGYVVGIDVSPETEFGFAKDYNGRPHFSEALMSRMPWRRKKQMPLPGIGNLLYRATTLSSVYQKTRIRRQANSWIRVPLEGVKLMDFSELDSIIETGRSVGMDRLQEVREWTLASARSHTPEADAASSAPAPSEVL